MNELRLTETEKKKLKSKYSTWLIGTTLFHYVENEEFGYVERLLTWLSDSDEERTSLKNSIKATHICLRLLQYTTKYSERDNVLDFKKIDKYIDWQFDSEKERVDFKLNLDLSNFLRETMNCWNIFNAGCLDQVLRWQLDELWKNDFPKYEENLKEIKRKIVTDDKDFVSKRIRDLWFSNYFTFGEVKAKNECLKFFNYFFESDEMSLKKRGIFERKAFFTDLSWLFGRQTKEKVEETFRKLFDFCAVTMDERRGIKEEIAARLGSIFAEDEYLC